MSTAPNAIPYERQVDPDSSRTCGAACLSMVYRSLGRNVAQAEIWPKISKRNRFGSLASTTHLMAQDASSRGFAALAIQARHPLQVLRVCRQRGVRAIVNHRFQQDAPTGHYSVVVAVGADGVVLHDPYLGPERRLPHAELLELWQPRYPDAEIMGNVLIGIAAEPQAAVSCAECGTAIPESVECPSCGKLVALQPAALIGCVAADCAARMWNYLCCSSCDTTWTFGIEAPPADEIPGNERDPWNLGPVFGELDRFCAHILTLPAAATRPEIRRYLDFIQASKERLKLAQVEEFVQRNAALSQLSTLQRQSGQEEEALLKAKEEIQRTGATPDGDALARALLKDLGLIR